MPLIPGPPPGAFTDPDRLTGPLALGGVPGLGGTPMSLDAEIRGLQMRLMALSQAMSGGQGGGAFPLAPGARFAARPRPAVEPAGYAPVAPRRAAPPGPLVTIPGDPGRWGRSARRRRMPGSGPNSARLGMG